MASVGFSVVYWVLKYPRDDDVDLWIDDDVVSDSYKDEVTASKKNSRKKHLQFPKHILFIFINVMFS